VRLQWSNNHISCSLFLTATIIIIITTTTAALYHLAVHASCSLNPVWTVGTGSLFIVSCTAEEFFTYNTGISFQILDHDSVTANDVVAECAIHQGELLQMKGERTSLELAITQKILDRNPNMVFRPKLHIRARKAKPKDREFIKTLHYIKRSKKEGVHADTFSFAPDRARLGLWHRGTKTVDGVKLVRRRDRRGFLQC
jgi:hypothetical protein